ncbi:MAG: hypothetical protein ACREN2_04370 [Candidatus Dormibacteria bacterium]
MNLTEMAQVAEQEHMRVALRRAAARAARREAGITWLQAVRMRVFAAPVSPARPAPPATARPAVRLRVIRAADSDCATADC